MKKWFASILIVMLISGCAPQLNKENENEVVQGKDEKKETSIIPNYQISDSLYRSILPFKASKTRGMVVDNLNSSYDIKEFETGLMRVAKENFSTDTYLFQEGQKLDQDTVRKWLNRKYTKAQLKELKLDEEDNVGLNPVNDEKGSIEKQNEKSPIYLAHILEHDYLVKDGKKARLSGVVIGLALNSIHYYQKEEYGATFEQPIKHEKLEAEGKKMAEEVLKRLRAMEGLGNIPITIALFEQNSRSAVVPGNFFAYAHAAQGSSSLGDWKDINEKHYLFPSAKAEDDHREDVDRFMRFKDEIEKYFPNYTGIIGRAFYKDDQIVNLKIDIPIQVFGEAEIIGFTQLAASSVMDSLDYFNVDVNISSINGAEALISKKSGDKEPFVHFYK
ncbi:CamS family sex pheromone protein [Lederbergia sp. NSJ-179]|uniref:CamS family sex pheromone protein n=1 Tax=Lederbergia sp. NSJ-179 TaxID=2931402 RepID=UPI001FD2EC5A|nr:CamS family sex pheromone protein [Lederbergia sp. NSJ-179]MCJ7840986.1 CamS family sex pheromone protein [Lederbergia sp. NSJ-179]